MKTNTLLLLFPLAAAIGFAQTNTTHIVPSATQFNGYTNYWHDDYKNAYRYGSLFKVAQLDIEKTTAQSRINVAEDLHLSGLDMEEGFLGAADFTDIKAFLAHVGDHKVAFVVSNDVDAAKRTVQLVEQKVEIMHDYRLHKGWFGAETLLKSVSDAGAVTGNQCKSLAVSICCGRSGEATSDDTTSRSKRLLTGIPRTSGSSSPLFSQTQQVRSQ